MPSPEKHAFLSASSAHRWLVCTASPHFESQFPDGTSVYAEEGTLAHAICELYARKKFTVMTNKKFTGELKKLQENPLYQEEMLKTAEAYVEYLTEKAMSFTHKPHFAFEVEVDLSAYIPEGFGTCDCVMIGDDTLHITDYKHGKGVAVSAKENPQMRLYALGALHLYRAIYGDQIQRVSMGICQPRLSDTASEDALTVDELFAWGDSIKPAAVAAFDGPGEFVPGEHCRFCKGKAQCAARAAHFMGFSEYEDAVIAGRMTEADVVAQDLKVMVGEDQTRVLSDEDVGELLVKAEGLVAWYKDLQDYATQTLLSGGEIPGWKIVEGRSNRSFSDTDEAFDALVAAGYDEAMLYERKAKTLSEIEKMLGKKTFGELMTPYVVRPKGKPSLVPESDKREAYVPGAAEFEGVENG
ncbi:MAG: DUF2800 domain-containing protein [Clostridia bacterium]|nr:DUF2800 domain-containing protein [Clostridia bacterium]